MLKFKTIYALSIGPMILIVLLFCAWRIYGTSVQFAYSVLIGICGMAFGFLIGFLASPYKAEKEKFSKMATAIAGFLAGYAATKIGDPVAEYLFKKDTVFSDPITGSNVLIFFSALVVSAINGYAYRMYLSHDEKPHGKVKQGE